MDTDTNNELDLLYQRMAEMEADQEQLRAALRQMTEQYARLSRAVEQSPVSIVITDNLGIIEYVNPRFSQLTGFSIHEVIGQNSRIVKSGQTPPEVYHSMWSTILKGDYWEGEFINKKKNGELYYEAARISALTSPEGQITNFVAVKEDITARKKAEDDLARHNREMEALYQNSLELTSQHDLNRLLQTIIERACRLLEIEAGMLHLTQPDGESLRLVASHHLPEEFCEDQVQIGEGLAGQVLQTGLPLILEDYLGCAAQISDTLAQLPAKRVLGVPLKVRQQVIGVVSMIGLTGGSFRDEQVLLLQLFADQAAIAVDNARLLEEVSQANANLKDQLAEIQAMQIKLREQAIRDPLTGLYNRRYLQETIDRETARSDRSKFPISILMIDIDYFKRINDTYGHPCGDEVLKTLARMLRCHLRLGDIVCRYGGEEFVVVMPGASPENAFNRAEHVRKEFGKSPIPCGYEDVCTTISVGVAAYPAHGSNGEEVLQAADRALYKAKQSGRDQTIIFQAAGA